MKTISYGTLLLNERAELLLGHASGRSYWDIPKGAGDEGEAAVDTALRELREECGLILKPQHLRSLGSYAYLPAKDLVLFATLIEAIDTRVCICSSSFTDRFGRLLPEMDDFRWVAFAALPEFCAKSMTALLSTRLSLTELLSQQRKVAPAARPESLRSL